MIVLSVFSGLEKKQIIDILHLGVGFLLVFSSSSFSCPIPLASFSTAGSFDPLSKPTFFFPYSK